MSAEKQKLVVLGAGFGGITAARTLAHGLLAHKLTETYEVVLIDRNSYHTFTPTLYEAATTTDYIASNAQLRRIITLPIKELAEKLPIHCISGEVVKIDTRGKELHFKTGNTIEYSYLIIALGSEPNYFDIEGLMEHALPLKSFADALRIRERILELVEVEQRPGVRILIGGGGPTGVELSGEIKNLLHELPRVIRGECADKVAIVDGGATILSSFDSRVITAAQKRLEYLEVETLSGKRISSVDAEIVGLNDGSKLPYDLLIWTGGVMPHHLTQTLPLKRDQSGKKILVNEYCKTAFSVENQGETNILGIGDAVCFIDEVTGRPVPSVAPTAINQARTAASTILNSITAGKYPLKVYRPKNYPYILPVGGKFAVAKLGPLVITGFIAWTLKGLVELNYFLSILPPLRALRYWLGGLWIFLRNDRLG